MKISTNCRIAWVVLCFTVLCGCTEYIDGKVIATRRVHGKQISPSSTYSGSEYDVIFDGNVLTFHGDGKEIGDTITVDREVLDLAIRLQNERPVD